MNVAAMTSPALLLVWLAFVVASVWTIDQNAFAEPQQTVVFAIGNNRSIDRNLPVLRFAEQDADRFLDAMHQVGRVAHKDTILLKQPDRTTFHRTLRKIQELVAARGSGLKRFVFYFSGHSDDRGLHLTDGFVSRDEIQALLRRGRKSLTRVLFLDGCFASGLAAKGVRQTRENPVTLPEEPTGAVALTASSSDEAAFESRSIRGSYFTHSVVEGLYGKGDHNQDGLVTVEELYQYVYRQAKLGALGGAPQQHPQLFSNLSGRGALVMSYPKTINRPVSLFGNTDGTLTLALKGGWRFFKFESTKQEKVRIQVPKGTYDVVLRRGGQIGQGTLVVTDTGATLDANALRWSDLREGGIAKGQESPHHMRFLLGMQSGHFANASQTTEAGAIFSRWGGSLSVGEWRWQLHVSAYRGRQWIDSTENTANIYYGQTGAGIEWMIRRWGFRPLVHTDIGLAYMSQRWRLVGHSERTYRAWGPVVQGGFGALMDGHEWSGIDWGFGYLYNHAFLDDESGQSGVIGSHALRLLLVLR